MDTNTNTLKCIWIQIQNTLHNFKSIWIQIQILLKVFGYKYQILFLFRYVHMFANLWYLFQSILCWCSMLFNIFKWIHESFAENSLDITFWYFIGTLNLYGEGGDDIISISMVKFDIHVCVVPYVEYLSALENIIYDTTDINDFHFRKIDSHLIDHKKYSLSHTSW